MKDVIIIGAGIAGLSAAIELQKENIDFHLLELSDRTGGNIESLNIEGHIVENGPYTLTSSNSDLLSLVDELGIKNELIEADPDSRKRYIYLQKKLVKLPSGLQELYKTDLLSKEGKKTLLEEFFIPKVEKEETVEEFISRRFGREVLKNIVQPFLCGVYAGDVKKLSANAVFPKLKELERNYKSVLLGFPISKGINSFKGKHTLFSFREGLSKLTDTIYSKVKNKVSLQIQNLEIIRAKDYFVVNFIANKKVFNYTTNAVLFAIPAYEMHRFSHLFPDKETMALFNIDYAPIVTVAQTIKKENLKQPLDGFGFLCSKEPHRKLLGTIWTSAIFPSRSTPDEALLNSFIGGAYHPKVVSQSEGEIEALVKKELCEIMNISSSELLKTINLKIYEKAIPQYYIGHL